MTLTDRQQFRQVRVGALGDLKTIANAQFCLDQQDQRFVEVDIGITATTATTDYTLPVGRFDRAVQVREVRILPGGALTFTAGNYTSLILFWTNDNTATNAAGGNGTILAAINTANTAANGGTGNWAAGTSIIMPLYNSNTAANGGANTLLNQSSNMIVPSGSQLFLGSLHTGGAGVAIPAGTRFQVLVEEY